MKRPRTQRRWEVTNDVAPSVYFGIDRKLTGVYTLEFKGGEKYVGKTVDLTSRIASHRRRWDDIIAISFIECGNAELDALERTMITQTEQSFRIRNKMFTRMPAGEAEIDLVVDKEQQAEWLEGVQPSYPLDERTRAAERRIRNRTKFDEFMAHPAQATALEYLTAYVNAVIPWPSATGGLYWGVSAMPSTSRTRDRRRLFTVNAHNVELYYLMQFSTPSEMFGILNVDSRIINRTDRRELMAERHSLYRSYPDCTAITVAGGEIADVLSRPSVLAAARSMALGLMRRGPSNFAKFHSDDLLDRVLVSRSEDATA